MEETLRNRFDSAESAEISVNIPWMTVVGADFFVKFMEENDLYSIASSDVPDDRIAHAFQKSQLPVELVGDLRSVAQQIQTPLAIRSSSLLEDALYRPFAGVYATKMIPNNSPSVDTRFQRLVEAIKFVYASTFFKSAKAYIRSIDEETTAEKMAVIIQKVVGHRRGDRFYPNISGVARSYNYYPVGHARREEGVVDLALGLGKTVVDGGLTWSFCPAYPKAPPPFNSIDHMLKSTQTKFWAVNMGKPPVYDPIRETEYLLESGLSEAYYDDTLRFVASTYVPQSDRIVPGVGHNGPRIIDFAPILALNEIPLNDLVKELLTICEEIVGNEVEIEFALNLDPKGEQPPSFGFLQVRPMVVMNESLEVSSGQVEEGEVLLASKKVLGSGRREDIEDIVYVRMDTFEPKFTPIIANELEKLNNALADERRPYLLIGFGRWGTSDPWRGIPITWDQISWARVIAEVDLPGMEADFSQGSHFFHNLTGFKVSYFSADHAGEHGIDFEWLEEQQEIAGTQYVRHVRTSRPLIVRIDSRGGRGVILRHG